MSEIKTIAKRSLLETAIAVAEEFPGVAAARKALNGALEAKTAKQFNDFIYEVSKVSAFGDVEEVCRKITEGMTEPWMQAGLEEGWTKSLEAIDPLAKRCIYQVVVDYLTRQKEPDIRHRQFANLFVECDEKILKVLFVAADHLATNKWTSASMLELSDLEGTRDSEDNLPLVHHLVLDGRSFIPLDVEAVEAGEILIRNRFGHGKEGPLPGDHPEHQRYEIDNYLCLLYPPKAPLWRQLRDYLEPVRQTIATAVVTSP